MTNLNENWKLAAGGNRRFQFCPINLLPHQTRGGKKFERIIFFAICPAHLSDLQDGIEI